MQWLHSSGYTEMNAAGNSLIMADVMIAYKNEGFYGDQLEVKLYATELSAKTFDLLYHISGL
jgi:acyl-CoA thioesterase FadM